MSRRPDLTKRVLRERIHKAQRMTLAGDSAQDIAVRLGVTPRTVVRYRALIRQGAAA